MTDEVAVLMDRSVESVLVEISCVVSGAGSRNGGYGSWETTLTFRRADGTVMGTKTVEGRERGASGNRVHVQALLQGLEALGDQPTKVLVRTTSGYVIDNLNRIGTVLALKRNLQRSSVQCGVAHVATEAPKAIF